MFQRAKTAKAPPSDGEVRVQKVEKIELVYNLVTKPPVYAKYPTVGHDVSSGKKKDGRGIVFIEDINKRSERYNRGKKKQFLG
jgi:hypothetical protein